MHVQRTIINLMHGGKKTFVTNFPAITFIGIIAGIIVSH